MRVKAGNGGHEKEEDLERRQEQRLKVCMFLLFTNHVLLVSIQLQVCVSGVASRDGGKSERCRADSSSTETSRRGGRSMGAPCIMCRLLSSCQEVVHVVCT